MIIQCDSGHTNGDLIACARYRIYDLRADVRDMDEQQVTHILFIIHLPHQVINSSLVGFQGDLWISSHIDDLRPTTDNSVSASEAIGLSISELFFGIDALDQHLLTESDDKSEIGIDEKNEDMSHNEEVPSNLELNEVIERREVSSESIKASSCQENKEQGNKDVRGTLLQLGDSIMEENVPGDVSPQEPSEKLSIRREFTVRSRTPLYCRLHGCIQAAASKLKDFTIKRSTKRVEILVQLIPNELPKSLGKFS